MFFRKPNGNQNAVSSKATETAKDICASGAFDFRARATPAPCKGLRDNHPQGRGGTPSSSTQPEIFANSNHRFSSPLSWLPNGHPPTLRKREKYFASSNPHPPHSRAYDRYNKFLRILETSIPNSHRPLPFPSCLRADLENSNIGSVNKSQAPSRNPTGD